MLTVGPNFTTVMETAIQRRRGASPISLSLTTRWTRDLRCMVEMWTPIALHAMEAWRITTSINWLEALLSARQLLMSTKEWVQVQAAPSNLESWPGMHRLRVAKRSYCNSSSSNSSNSSSIYSEDSNSPKARQPISRWSNSQRAERSEASPAWTWVRLRAPLPSTLRSNRSESTLLPQPRNIRMLDWIRVRRSFMQIQMQGQGAALGATMQGTIRERSTRRTVEEVIDHTLMTTQP